MRATKHLTDDEVIIGRNVRRMRNARQLTQSDLAKCLFITFQQVQKYERGENRISCGRLIDMARIFDTSILDFFEHIDLPKVPPPKILTCTVSAQELRDEIERELRHIEDVSTLKAIRVIVGKSGMSEALSNKHAGFG